MTFKGKAKKGYSNPVEPDGKMSLWASDDRKYIANGYVTIGETRYKVYLYEAKDKKTDRSADYYGYVYLDEKYVPPEVSEKQYKAVPKYTKTNVMEVHPYGDSDPNNQTDDDSDDGIVF